MTNEASRPGEHDRDPGMEALAAAALACPVGIVVADSAGRVLAANPAAASILGRTEIPRGEAIDERLAGTPLREVPRQGAVVAVAGGWALRREASLPGGGRAWFLMALDPPPRDGPRPWDAWTLAALDPRTGLPGERALRLVLATQLARCRRYATPLSMVVVRPGTGGADTAHHGVEGDGTTEAAALRATARAVRGLLRWADLVGVSDAGEVLVALPETGEAEGRTLLARLCDEVRRALAEAGLAARLEAGLAGWDPGEPPESLLARARAALAPCPDGEAAARTRGRSEAEASHGQRRSARRRGDPAPASAPVPMSLHRNPAGRAARTRPGEALEREAADGPGQG